MSIYVSHSRENSGAALKLSDELVKRGVSVWLDLRELDGGADWRERVTAAIKAADGFVFLVGRGDFIDIDRQQRFEWTQVVDQEIFLDPAKPLIPFQLGDGELPGFLGARKAIQVVPGDQTNIDYPTVAGEVLKFLDHPSDSMDEKKLERGRQARAKSQARLENYVTSLRQDDFKRAAIRELK